MGTSMLSQAMDHSRKPASDTFKAIYAIREQSKEGIVQIRGMGCLVNTTCKGSKRLQLVTCSGVLDGVAGKSLVMDRYTSHPISDVEDYRLRYPLTNKKVDSFCFGPVDIKSSENKKAKWPSLALQVPVEEVNKDHKVITFVGNKPLTLDLEYKNDQHKVVVSKSCIVDKTSLQGAPIIDLRQNDCVVGLLQWSSVEKQFIPIFLKNNVLTELAEQKIPQELQDPTDTPDPGQQNVAQQPQDLAEAPLAEQNHNNQQDPTAGPSGQQNVAQQPQEWTDGPLAEQNHNNQQDPTAGPSGLYGSKDVLI